VKCCLRIGLAVLTLPFLLLWFIFPLFCLILIATEYAWTGKVRWGRHEAWRYTMGTVGDRQRKWKELRMHLVKWVNARRGRWLLGSNVVDDVRKYIGHKGIHTTAGTLAKELRKAERKGEIRKRINDCGMVEYSANPPADMLFEVGPVLHGHGIGRRRA
jgi:hypothetical protein